MGDSSRFLSLLALALVRLGNTKFHSKADDQYKNVQTFTFPVRPEAISLPTTLHRHCYL